jgi:UDP-2,3-diacylglucosamine pyrophosphatase LpxH
VDAPQGSDPSGEERRAAGGGSPVEEDELTLVVSDLHLGADPELDDFYCDLEFADFLRYHGQREAKVHLVVNGDFIDFLQIDPRGEKRVEREQGSPLWMSEAEAEEALIAAAERHRVFFDALAEFLRAPGRRCSMLRGNHDLELSWPLVQARMRALLGHLDDQQLAFPLDALFDEATGVYIEHGAQYDPINAVRDLRDPFLDRRRRKIEVPVGTVIVKLFWNRVEREFPHVDKIRPMIDSVTALVVQRPTYLFLRFDYFLDLAFGVIRAGASGLRRLIPRRGGPPPTGSGDPRTLGQRLARPGAVGKWTALTTLTFLGYLATRAALLWDQPDLRDARVARILERLFLHFVTFVGISVGTVIMARLLRLVLLRVPTLALVRNVLYRLLVAASAGIFFWALLRLFWIPIAGLAAFYVLLDASRTVSPSVADEALGVPQEPEVMAALRLLKHDRVKTVVFGHTHVPMQVELPTGKRYVNSGTWVKLIDLRHARTAPVELNTYVQIRRGQAELMSWRGTEPARHFGAPTPLPVLATAAS